MITVKWNSDVKRRTFSYCTFQPQPPLMCLYNGFNQAQPQPGTAHMLCAWLVTRIGFFETPGLRDYDIARHISDRGDWSLSPFVRVEVFDTQASVPDGFAEDESKIGEIYTIGLTYKPISNVAIKADFQDFENDSETAINQANLGIGYMF